MLNNVKTLFFHLRNIPRLRPMLAYSVAERLFLSFLYILITVMPFLLEFPNSGLTNFNICLSGARTDAHITPVFGFVALAPGKVSS